MKSKLRNLQGKNYMHSYDEIANELHKVGFKLVRKEGFNWLLFDRTSELLSAYFGQDGKTVEAEEDAKRESLGDDARRKARVKAVLLSS